LKNADEERKANPIKYPEYYRKSTENGMTKEQKNKCVSILGGYL
jgi:hypothetical protein